MNISFEELKRELDPNDTETFYHETDVNDIRASFECNSVVYWGGKRNYKGWVKVSHFSPATDKHKVLIGFCKYDDIPEDLKNRVKDL